jgi:hypothetical protein
MPLTPALPGGETGFFTQTYLQVHSFAGFLHPEQTLFSIGLPQILQGVHPHVWHMDVSLPCLISFSLRFKGGSIRGSEVTFLCVLFYRKVEMFFPIGRSELPTPLPDSSSNFSKYSK